jgi:hypothetical protein
MSTKKIDEAVRRTYRYYYDDGIVEMAVGLLFVLTGGVLFAWMGVGSSVWVTVILILAMLALAAGGILLLTQGIKIAKERVTYPRTGYVSYREKNPNRGRWWFMAMAIIIIVTAGFWPEALNDMSILIGALLFIVLAYLGYRVGLRRFFLTATATLLIGLVSASLVTEEFVGVAVTFGASGMVLLLSGVCAFRSYLDSNPVPVAGDNHE